MDRWIDPSAHLMRPENNDEPQRNPTRPGRTLRKIRSSHSQKEPYLLRNQAKRASPRKAILQGAQDVIMLTVDGQKDKYGAAKGILETAQLEYPWITRHKVYAKMRLLKQPRPVMIDKSNTRKDGQF